MTIILPYKKKQTNLELFSTNLLRPPPVITPTVPQFLALPDMPIHCLIHLFQFCRCDLPERSQAAQIINIDRLIPAGRHKLVRVMRVVSQADDLILMLRLLRHKGMVIVIPDLDPGIPAPSNNNVFLRNHLNRFHKISMPLVLIYQSKQLPVES
jgi:hypothetical protein